MTKSAEQVLTETVRVATGIDIACNFFKYYGQGKQLFVVVRDRREVEDAIITSRESAVNFFNQNPELLMASFTVDTDHDLNWGPDYIDKGLLADFLARHTGANPIIYRKKSF